jgi:hypothetical protein
VPASIEAAQHISTRNVVPALSNAAGNSLQGKAGRNKPKVDDFNAVTSLFPPLNSGAVDQTAQRAFESEVHLLAREAVQLGEEQATGCERGQFRAERGKAGREQIGVHEVNNGRLTRKKFPRECSFPCAFQPARVS